MRIRLPVCLFLQFVCDLLAVCIAAGVIHPRRRQERYDIFTFFIIDRDTFRRHILFRYERTGFQTIGKLVLLRLFVQSQRFLYPVFLRSVCEGRHAGILRSTLCINSLYGLLRLFLIRIRYRFLFRLDICLADSQIPDQFIGRR